MVICCNHGVEKSWRLGPVINHNYSWAPEKIEIQSWKVQWPIFKTLIGNKRHPGIQTYLFKVRNILLKDGSGKWVSWLVRSKWGQRDLWKRYVNGFWIKHSEKIFVLIVHAQQRLSNREETMNQTKWLNQLTTQVLEQWLHKDSSQSSRRGDCAWTQPGVQLAGAVPGLMLQKV